MKSKRNHKSKYKNKGKTLSEKMILELCTPVHVGSGEELKQSFDFIMKESVPFVVDVEQTLNSIQPHEPRLKSFYNRADIKDLVEVAGEKYGYELPYFSLNKGRFDTVGSSNRGKGGFSKNQKVTYHTIREQIKDAFFRPYLPGSSVKGAVRTALFAATLPSLNLNQIIENYKSKNKKEKNGLDNYITKKVFGFDPQKDIMRALHISDGYFCTKDMRLGDVRMVNICDGKTKWKNMAFRKVPKNQHPSSSHNSRQNPNEREWIKAKGLHTEVLTSGSRAEFVFSYDQFLSSDFSSWEEGRSSFSPFRVKEGIKNFDKLRAVLNHHALNIIENELVFFKKHSLPKVCEFYNNLKSKIQSDKQAAYLRFSWGSGWTGMTGITDQLLSKNISLKKHITQKLNKNPKTHSPHQQTEIKHSILYPKTRRLLVHKGSPCLPLGWAKLYPSDGSVSNPYQFFVASKQIKSNTPLVSPWLFRQVPALCKTHKLKNSDEVLASKALAQEWKKLNNSEEKQKVLKEIKTYWENKGWWDSSQRNKKKTKLIYEGEN